MKVIRLAFTRFLFLGAALAAFAVPARAFSILGHRVIALRLLHAVRNAPSDYPPFLTQIARDAELTRWFLGGTDAPDYGAMAGFPRPDIQYSTHYEHPGLWIKALFTAAHDDRELAFAWGWVVHEGADLQIHPWMDKHGLNYCDVGIRHTIFEMEMDGRFGSTYAEYSDEGVQGDSETAPRLLHEARTIVRSATGHSDEYDRYLEALHKRCSGTAAVVGDTFDAARDARLTTGGGGEAEESAAPAEFRAVKELELTIGKVANAGLDYASELRRDAATASGVQRAVAFAAASALEYAKLRHPSSLRVADNADIVQLYGFAPATIREMLAAAGRGDWPALDRNFDTGDFVHDPMLNGRQAPSHLDVALVLDSSGSMTTNDPRDLRKRSAEFVVDRAPASARFTIVRFDSEAAVLARASTDRDEVRRAIAAVGASGGTLICKAAYAALSALSVPDAAQKAIILLTDGLSQDSCDPADLARAGVPIFTVGLSEEANGAFLQSIAARTDAAYVHARTPNDLQSIFDMLLAQLMNESSVVEFNGTALPGAVYKFLVPIDATIRSLDLLLMWPGSTLDLTLVSPHGRTVSASLQGRVAATWQTVHVDAPEPGTWVASVRSVQVAPTGEPFRLRASAETPLRVHIEPAESEIQPAMRARLDGFAASTTHVTVSVQRPDGKKDDAEVVRDGDGSFLARYPRADAPGAYTFVWSVLQGMVSRGAIRSFFVGDAGIRGGTIQSIEGQYARWNRGSLHGIRHGLPVRILRGGQEIGRGRATDVRAAEADVEIDSVTGVDELLVGDEIQVELDTWALDGNGGTP